MADMATIHQMLTDIAASTQFTPAALKQFQDALSRAEGLEKNLASMQKERDYYKNLAEDRERLLKAQESREDKVSAREEAVAKREVAMTELTTKVAVAEAKEGVRKEVFETLFKGRIIREKFQDMVSGGGNVNGVYQSTNETHNVDKTVEEG